MPTTLGESLRESRWATLQNKANFEIGSKEFYDAAARDMKLIDDSPEKLRLIRDSLPSRIREEWDRKDYARQDDPAIQSIDQKLVPYYNIHNPKRKF